MSTKSLVCNSSFENAKRSHNCRANSKHRIESGEIRLKVKNGRSWNYYCKNCALRIIEKDQEKLSILKSAIAI